MFRLRSIAIGVLVTLFLTSTVAISGDWISTWCRTRNSVHKLIGITTLYRDRFSKYTCSAVLVKEKTYLTAAHCYDETAVIAIDGWQATLIKVDISADLALFSTPKSQGIPIKLRKDRALPGTEVMVIGYALAATHSKPAFGFVSDESDVLPGYSEWPASMWFDATVIGGHSGGAILDRSGRLVSIVQASFGSEGHYYMLGPTQKTLKAFVEGYL